ncbi:tetratricopeptide repeat protein [Undibacterium sp. SXout7W]|uniref:tetratricopeptide repeat protein n=1 Tax=Undibacterium sp. SXout7W TaxID=3413049 RepID=UPI003BF0E671
MNSRIFKYAIAMSAITLTGISIHLAHADDFEDGVNLYENQEMSEAADAFQAAADKDNADAQFNLGLMYLNGEGIEENYQQAMHWFEQSAAQNNVRAQVNLARMYAKGKGVAPDYNTAVSWFKKAADQGYADAQYSLGVLYVTGNGTSLDFNKAKDLFQQAADQNNASAQYQLGLMYFKGKGMTVDKVEAYKWMTLAGEYDDAVTFREYARQSMSEEQIEEATATAREWEPVATTKS